MRRSCSARVWNSRLVGGARTAGGACTGDARAQPLEPGGELGALAGEQLQDRVDLAPEIAPPGVAEPFHVELIDRVGHNQGELRQLLATTDSLHDPPP